MNQLNFPTYLFVDEEQAVYVSDSNNHHVMKWNKDAKEGIVVAGGRGQRKRFNTVCLVLNGLFVDTSSTIYVVDSWNDRVKCC